METKGCDKEISGDHFSCTGFLLPLRDALDVVGGKWKTVIILALAVRGTTRFKQLQRDLEGISAKTLSKELKDLELNGLVTRTVEDSMPVSVSYDLTPYAESLVKVLRTLREWGVKHREHMHGVKPRRRRKGGEGNDMAIVA